MTATLSIVWKDAREHRVVLFAIGLLLPLATLIPFALCNPCTLKGNGLPWLMASLGVLAVSLAIAPSLIPSETNGDGLRFLARLPIAPSRILWAKTLFLLASAFGAALAGFVIATVARLIFVPTPDPLAWSASDLLLVGAPLGAALWMVAVSCWIPRALAVLPAAAVIVVLCALPVHLALDTPLIKLAPTNWNLLLALGLLAPLSATLVSWFGGLPRTERAGPARRRGMLTIVLFALPAWGWSGWLRHDVEVIDPTRDETWIADVIVASDLRHAYVNLGRSGVPYEYPVVVDLSTGSWQPSGEPGEPFTTLEALENAFSSDRGLHRHVVQPKQRGGMNLVDAISGKVERVLTAQRPSRTIPDLVQEDLRESTQLRDGSNRRVYAFGGKLYREEEPGRFAAFAEYPVNALVMPVDGGGLAFQRWDAAATSRPRAERTEIFDLRSGRRWTRPDVPGGSETLLTPQGWLVFRRDTRNPEMPCALIDPAAGTSTAVAGLARGDQPVCALDQDHLLVFRPVTDHRRAPELHVLLLGSGACRPLLDEAGTPLEAGPEWVFWPRLPLRTDDAQGAWILPVRWGGRAALARLDPVTLTAQVTRGAAGWTPVRWDSWFTDLRPIAVAADGSVLAREARRIVRLWFGSDRREVLFPKP